MVEYTSYAGGIVVDGKLVPNPDFDKVIAHLDKLEQPHPNQLMTVAFCAEEDGVITDFCIIQSLPFAEPFHGPNGDRLAVIFETAKDFILGSGAPRVLMHTDNRAMKRMLVRAGATEMTDTFFDWIRK